MAPRAEAGESESAGRGGPVFIVLAMSVVMGPGLSRNQAWQIDLEAAGTAAGQAEVLSEISQALLLVARDYAHTAHGVKGRA
ncbi:MAG: hypothetical protein N2036_12645 [Bryobacteraceae bacterium]|nr:hypothetical protein [Bryobacteraceae bacterium]